MTATGRHEYFADYQGRLPLPDTHRSLAYIPPLLGAEYAMTLRKPLDEAITSCHYSADHRGI